MGSANQLHKSLLFAAGVTFLLTRRVDRVILTMIALIIGATAISAGVTDFPYFGIGRYLKSAFSLLSILLLLAGRPTIEDRDFLLRLLAWAPIACVAIGALYSAAGIHPLFAVDFLSVNRLQGSNIPSGLGSICYVGAIAAVLASAYIDRRYLYVCAASMAILTLCAARMPFAMAAVVSVVAFYTYHARTLGKAYLATYALIVLGGLGAIVAGQGILNRFESDNNSGRDLIWQALDSVRRDYPLFGIGLGHQIEVVPDEVIELTKTIAAHNEYLRLALETGYFGVVTIVGLFIGIFVYMFLTRPLARTTLFVVMVASFFIYCLTDNVISSNVSLFALVMASFISIRPLSERPRVPVHMRPRPLRTASSAWPRPLSRRR
jgi:O-antigen ligase